MRSFISYLSSVMTICIIFYSTVVVAQQSDTVKLTPQIREVDRSEAFFSSIPCDDIHSVKVYSKKEQQLLRKRQKQCVSQLDAFLPKPVNR